MLKNKICQPDLFLFLMLFLSHLLRKHERHKVWKLIKPQTIFVDWTNRDFCKAFDKVFNEPADTVIAQCRLDARTISWIGVAQKTACTPAWRQSPDARPALPANSLWRGRHVENRLLQPSWGGKRMLGDGIQINRLYVAIFKLLFPPKYLFIAGNLRNIEKIKEKKKKKSWTPFTQI